MATNSSILGWRIPWTEEPGGLQSMGLQRTRHNWSDIMVMYLFFLLLTAIQIMLITCYSKYCSLEHSCTYILLHRNIDFFNDLTRNGIAGSCDLYILKDAFKLLDSLSFPKCQFIYQLSSFQHNMSIHLFMIVSKHGFSLLLIFSVNIF